MKSVFVVWLLVVCAVLSTAAGCAPQSASLPEPPEGLASDYDLTGAPENVAYAQVSRMQVYTEEIVVIGTVTVYTRNDCRYCTPADAAFYL